METLIIEPTVGYMLKVLKSGKKISKFKDEFAAIRHGDYFGFINMIKEPIPFMISYKNGVVAKEVEAGPNDCDFEGLYKAGPSLKLFYSDCEQQYGKFTDQDITDLIFGKAVLFEVSLRMHANNFGLLEKREILVSVINKLSSYKNLSHEDRTSLHKGRRFINMIKHFKNQFETWEIGIKEFKKGYRVLVNNELTIFKEPKSE
ncbi:MAG: hypothetical protein WC760_11595 [Bacteroidia bacterium]|jgi:hypothetical protein